MPWILKTEPSEYSFADLEREKITRWDGVRNYQARNNLRSMKTGDPCLIYESVGPKKIVGSARVSQEAYPDPKDPSWLCVDIALGSRFPNTVSLDFLKSDPVLSQISLVKQSRLSVCPITQGVYQSIVHVCQLSSL
ncbi:MAG: EVE domain-containing protein [Myxococcaceae bacterium]|nr:EVE domain-containing protein [Myxococcaceae bacterium]MBH2006291.1 EVE domain-containing protein [Myxococcaceae bacterium]